MYDAVFKHLMEDKKIAKLFLSALTGLDIRSLQPLPQELIVDIGDNPQRPGQPMQAYRLDYAARVRDKDGSERVVILEIQRQIAYRQDMRFRKYLGKQYMDGDFTMPARGRRYPVGIPVLPIYFLGEPPEGFEDVPILLVDLLARDRRTMAPLKGTNSFIDALFHKGILINTRALHTSGDELETLLSIFNPFYQTENPHIMSVNEALFPKTYQGLLKRLHAVIQNKEVRNKMSAEDDFLAEMQAIADLHTRELASARRKQEQAERQKEEERRRKEQAEWQKEQALRKQEQAERQKEEALRKQEQAERQKEEEQRQKEQALQKQDEAIRLLLQLGIPKSEIAQKLGLSEEDMERL
jgi:hypothetical protein